MSSSGRFRLDLDTFINYHGTNVPVIIHLINFGFYFYWYTREANNRRQ